MIPDNEIKSAIKTQEAFRDKYVRESQADLNARAQTIQQLDQERLNKLREYQQKTDQMQGAIDQLKKLVEPSSALEVVK